MHRISPVNKRKEYELRDEGLDHEQHDMSETCETTNAATDQVIPRLVRDIASGRAEDSILLHKQSTMLPQTNRVSICMVTA